MRRQFHEEASILARLDHPNLPKVSDFFSEGGREYLVMDFVDGQNLEDALQQQSPLPEKPVLIWAAQVLDALNYLHNLPHPIIHRDIKPANLRLTPQGKIKVVDFGLVKLMDPHDPRTRTIQRGLGTPEYAPLEQYASGPDHTDGRSDLYALGATLYHLLTGQAPPNVHQRVLDPTVLLPPRQLNPLLSTATAEVILRAMEIQPWQRYQSAKEMKQALSSGATTPISLSAGSSSIPSPPANLQKSLLWSGGGALAGALLAAIPRIFVGGDTGGALDLLLYTGMLSFTSVGAVAGLFVARRVGLSSADFLPKLLVSLLITLVVAGLAGLGIGAILLSGGVGFLPLLLAYLGSVTGSILGLWFTESKTFRQINWDP